MKAFKTVALAAIALSAVSVSSMASAESATCRTKRIQFENAVAAVNRARGTWMEPVQQAYFRIVASDYFNSCGIA
jgi:hypothetical protein